MKFIYCELCIFKIGHRLPRPLRSIVTDPIYQILKLALVELGVQNLLDLELGQTVHVEGGGDLLDSAWEFVCHMWL